MGIVYNGNNVTDVVFNGNSVNLVYKDGTLVWRRPFTVTWSYQSSYGTWTSTTTTVGYGEYPSAPVSPSAVESGSYRQAPTGWDDTSVIYGNRTITMGYTQQYYVTFSGTRCSCSNYSSGWFNSGTSISPTWSANSNCAFNSSGSTSSTGVTQTISAPTTISKSAGYIYVTISSTRCTANKSTGYVSYNTTITWTASSGYAFDSSGTSTSTASATSAGGTYSKSANYQQGTLKTFNLPTGSISYQSSKYVDITYYGAYTLSCTFRLYVGSGTKWTGGGTGNVNQGTYDVAYSGSTTTYTLTAYNNSNAKILFTISPTSSSKIRVTVKNDHSSGGATLTFNSSSASSMVGWVYVS